MAEYIQWLRRQIGAELVPLAYATAVVRDDAGRVLFQRRADFGPAWWGLPGGLFEPGESPHGCLVREVEEETGLRVEPLRLTGLYSSPRYAVTYPNGHQVQQVTLCYDCRILGGSLRAQTDEVTQLRFFAPGRFPPRPLWYADMLDHAIESRPRPYFDPPETRGLETPYDSLLTLRRRLGSAPLVWPTAYAAIFDDQRRLLLLRRGDDGSWAFPAGALDTGESLARTAQREALEETGLRVTPTRMLGVYSGHQLHYPNGDQLFPVTGVFACHVTGGAPRPDGHESLELRYFAQPDLPPLPSHLQQIAADTFAATA